MARQHPPAALVMGLLAGCLAALAILPTAFPLMSRLAEAEEALAFRQSRSAVSTVVHLLSENVVMEPGTRERLGVSHLTVHGPDGAPTHQEGPELPARAIAQACEGVEGIRWGTDQGVDMALSCSEGPSWQVVAATPIEPASPRSTLQLVFGLAGIVGIVTALGVLRLLRPLSHVSRAVAQVGAGERGVQVASTGLLELDELTEKLNDAARAMEAREDAILSRIQTVQSMARMVAHEVRNPLQSLELLTSLIAAEESVDERHDLAKAIHAEIRGLDLVVTRVLREGASNTALRLHRTPQSLRPLLNQILALRGPEAQLHGVNLELGEITDREVSVDVALLGRSVENLVLNALQVVPPQRGAVRLDAVEEEGELVIRVDDNGPGVDGALAEHIFEPNVSGRTGGTGLGLALVREVVEAHGGRITHEASPLGGARFAARIPLGEDEGERQAPRDSHRR